MTSSMTSAAIYARVSSARQKKDETIASQTAALRAHAEQLGLDVPEDWVFEDEGHSGSTLVRPALERLRDLVAGVGIDVVLCYAPDRLARLGAVGLAAPASMCRMRRRPERRSRHCRVRADSSISAMLSQDPCLGVWWISSRWARVNALAGSNASYSEPREWVLRLSMTRTTFSASG